MKIIFFGSDDFAAAYLKELLFNKIDVVAVVTQPDRAKGRGMKVIELPIKMIGTKHNCDILQPESFDDDVIAQLKSYDADYFIVIAYGRILKADVLRIPSKAAINVHGSLLPKYRGAAPINWAVINGETVTGVTVMLMNERMDAGDILAQHKISVKPEETAADVRQRMMDEGPGFLVESLKCFDQGKITPIPQDEKQVTYAAKLDKVLGLIDWNKSAKELNNLVRGLTPWPKAYTLYKGKQLKILRSHVVDYCDRDKVGTVLEVAKDGFLVQTGKNALFVEQVHLQDAKSMDAGSFLRGHDLQVGERLG